MDEKLRAQLAAVAAGALGSDGTLTPASIDEVAAIARVLSATATPFSVSSGAAAAGSGEVLISINRLTALQLREASLTLRAEAGASLASVRQACERAKLAPVGLLPFVRAERVGGLVARGEVPRRTIAGVEAVLATGEIVRSGGSVLKDVVGYDLPALLLGSMGRLALIVAVTFRLEPAAAHTPTQPPAGVTQSGDGMLARAFDPQNLLRARQA